MDYQKVQRLTIKLLGCYLFLFNSAIAAAANEKIDADKQLFDQAVQLSAQSKWQQAESIYRELLERNSDWPEPKNNLAIILLKTNRLDQAKQMLEQAVSSSPSYRIAQKNRTQLYNYLASRAYDKALGAKEAVSLPELELIQTVHQPIKIVEKKIEVIVEKPVVKTIEVPVVSEAKSKPEATDAVDAQSVNLRIEQQLLGWSRAWSQGDFEHYIKSYSREFVPEDARKSFNDWKNIRRGRLKFSRGVNVSVDQLRVFLEPTGSHALVEFVQNYQSDSYSDKVLKQLYMHHSQGDWLILSERVIKTY